MDHLQECVMTSLNPRLSPRPRQKNKTDRGGTWERDYMMTYFCFSSAVEVKHTFLQLDYTRNTHAQSMPRAEEYPEICK